MQTINDLNNTIINCTACPRLVEYRRDISEKKVRRFREHNYWGKPVPGFGDPEAQIFIIGLAPAAHGANRTGRMFTGDSSGDWLYKALYDNGFSNQPESNLANDGLRLSNVFITALIRCAPPQNKPLTKEIKQCSTYLHNELQTMKNIRVVITLGRLAFDNYCKMTGEKGLSFGHGVVHKKENQPDILCSYHPSRQNTQTGRLKWPEWNAVFARARELLN